MKLHHGVLNDNFLFNFNLINHPFPEPDHNRFFPKATEGKENVRCTFLANGRGGVLAIFSCHPFPEPDHNCFFPKATEGKENVQCTFLANGRGGVLAIFSCHPFPELDQNLNVPMDDN
ncbi:hypothetical protein [Bizionia sp.]|uniref:hypothetical protein n=1 Tax=Bizionia sp. TaxID=1954480 RepID=UPI003A91A195